MDYLNNTLKIIHRDLKGRNVFLTKRDDGKLITKIGDFGNALNKVFRYFPNHFKLGTCAWKVSTFFLLTCQSKFL